MPLAVVFAAFGSVLTPDNDECGSFREQCHREMAQHDRQPHPQGHSPADNGLGTSWPRALRGQAGLKEGGLRLVFTLAQSTCLATPLVRFQRPASEPCLPPCLPASLLPCLSASLPHCLTALLFSLDRSPAYPPLIRADMLKCCGAKSGASSLLMPHCCRANATSVSLCG